MPFPRLRAASVLSLLALVILLLRPTHAQPSSLVWPPDLPVHVPFGPSLRQASCSTSRQLDVAYILSPSLCLSLGGCLPSAQALLARHAVLTTQLQSVCITPRISSVTILCSQDPSFSFTSTPMGLWTFSIAWRKQWRNPGVVLLLQNGPDQLSLFRAGACGPASAFAIVNVDSLLQAVVGLLGADLPADKSLDDKARIDIAHFVDSPFAYCLREITPSPSMSSAPSTLPSSPPSPPPSQPPMAPPPPTLPQPPAPPCPEDCMTGCVDGVCASPEATRELQPTPSVSPVESWNAGMFPTPEPALPVPASASASPSASISATASVTASATGSPSMSASASVSMRPVVESCVRGGREEVLQCHFKRVIVYIRGTPCVRVDIMVRRARVTVSVELLNGVDRRRVKLRWAGAGVVVGRRGWRVRGGKWKVWRLKRLARRCCSRWLTVRVGMTVCERGLLCDREWRTVRMWLKCSRVCKGKIVGQGWTAAPMTWRRNCPRCISMAGWRSF